MSDTQQAFSNLIDIFGNAESDRLKKKQLEEDRAYRNAQTLENNRRWGITNDRAVANQKVVDDERNRQEAIRNASLTRGSYGALVGDRTRTNLLDAQDQLAVKAGYKKADHGGMNYSQFIATNDKPADNNLKNIESRMWGTNLQNGVQGKFKEQYPTASKNEDINNIRKYINQYGKDGDIGKKLNDVDYGRTYDYNSTFNYNVNKLMGAGASASEAADQVTKYMGAKPVADTSESYKRIKDLANSTYNAGALQLKAQYDNDLKQSNYEDKINNMGTKKMLMTEYPDINKSSWFTTDNRFDGDSSFDASLDSFLNTEIKGLVDKDGNKLVPLTVKQAVKTGLITNVDIKRTLSGNMDTVSAGGRDIDAEGVNNLVNLIKARAKLSEDKLKKATMSKSQRLTDKYKSDLTKLANMRTATLNSTNTPKPISDSERVDKLFKDIKPYNEQTPKTVVKSKSGKNLKSKQKSITIDNDTKKGSDVDSSKKVLEKVLKNKNSNSIKLPSNIKESKKLLSTLERKKSDPNISKSERKKASSIFNKLIKEYRLSLLKKNDKSKTDKPIKSYKFNPLKDNIKDRFILNRGTKNIQLPKPDRSSKFNGSLSPSEILRGVFNLNNNEYKYTK